MTGLSITALCQTRSDSAIVAKKDLLKGAVLIEQGIVCKEEVVLLNKALQIAENRLGTKDSLIEATRQQVKLQEGITQLERSKSAVQLSVKDTKIAELTDREKRVKRKLFWSHLIGGAVVVYLLWK